MRVTVAAAATAANIKTNNNIELTNEPVPELFTCRQKIIKVEVVAFEVPVFSLRFVSFPPLRSSIFFLAAATFGSIIGC